MYTRKNTILKKQIGILLIDLMIAMLLGTLLVACLLKMFIVYQNNASLQNALNVMQRNAVATIDILSEEIHKSGYIGCAKLNSEFPITSLQNYSINSENKLIGTDNILIVRHVAMPVILNQDMQNNSVINTTNEIRFSVNDILLISDCSKAEIFQAAAISHHRQAQTIIATQALHNVFSKNAEVAKLKINKFFIAPTNRKHSDGSVIYALYVQDLHQRKMELVEDINAMRIRYLILLKDKILKLSANQIQDWTSVLGATIEFEVVYPPYKKTWYIYAVQE